MDESKKFIPSDKVKKIQVGSIKHHRGYTIYVFLCIRLDIRRLNYGSHFQYELEKGDKVISKPLSFIEVPTKIQNSKFFFFLFFRIFIL